MGWDMRVQLRPLALRVGATLRTSKRPSLYLSVVFKAVSHAVRNSLDLTPYGRIASSFWSSGLCLPGAETTSLHPVHEVPYGVQAFVNVRQAHHLLSYVPNNAFCVSRWWRTHPDPCRSHQFCWGQSPEASKPHTALLLSSFADRTWAYSFSGAVLFSMGFLVGLLCYLGYKYITKPPVPPNSLVSHPPGAREGHLGERPSKS